jgi:hypothetical protein
MPGLIREARDMQGIRDSTRKGGGGGGGGGDKPAASSSSPSAEGEPPAERGPRKKS